MQTFLPYPDFQKTAKILDYKRLGKQRVECKQILNALLNPETKGWINHPAVRMWRGYEWSLTQYYNCIVWEWIMRGYNNNMPHIVIPSILGFYKLPKWFGNRSFHLAHQSNLLRKNTEHYGKYFKNIPNDLPYIWPV